jgi:hypothetical protein
MYMIIYMYGIMHFLPFCVFVCYVDTQSIRQNTFKEVILHETIIVCFNREKLYSTDILLFLCRNIMVSLFVCLFDGI